MSGFLLKHYTRALKLMRHELQHSAQESHVSFCARFDRYQSTNGGRSLLFLRRSAKSGSNESTQPIRSPIFNSRFLKCLDE